MSQLERNYATRQKIGNSAHTYKPISNHFRGGFGRKPDADSTVKVLDLPDSDVLEGGSNVLYEALLEVLPIVPLESELVVMGDDNSHRER
jgi:hypothetical protein